MEPLLFTLMVLLFPSTGAWEFTISRNSTNKLSNGLVDSIDQFNISKCNNSNLCTTFGGQKLQDKCQCVCIQEKSTFGFYNNRWGCTNNSIVQQYSGCQYNLDGPSGISNRDDHPLFTLPVLGSHNDNNYVKNIPTNKSCKVIAANATFLQCNGTWGRLTESSVTAKLSFQDQRRGMVYVGPYQPSSPVVPSVDGRVIRIPIKCEGQTWNSSQCVTFKINGQLSCSTKKAPSLVPVSTQTYQSTTTAPDTGIIKTSRMDGPTPAVAVIVGSIVGGVVFIKVLLIIITLVLRLKRERNERIKNMKGTGSGTNGAENHVTRTDAETDSPRQFAGEVVSNVEDNQESRTTREIEPYCQFSKAEIVNHQDNWMAGCERETMPDYYQYPGVEMVPTKDNWVAGCERETVPDYYQYPGVEMVPTKDNWVAGCERETVPDYYQYPGVEMVPTKDNTETGPKRESTVSYYHYPRVEMMTSSESNSPPVSDKDDDSLYEIMNSPYQNIGNSREQLEHPYVNIC